VNRFLVVAATLIVATTTAFAVAIPAHAGSDGVDPCKLLRKKEAKKILGAKIVDIEEESDESTDAMSCKWVSNEYEDDDFEERGSAYALEVTWQPMTDEVRQALDEEDDLEPIDGLGDEAYINGFDVVVIQGDNVIATGTNNWAGDITPQTDRARRAARIALARLPQG
jgi:hypothetical protein